MYSPLSGWALTSPGVVFSGFPGSPAAAAQVFAVQVFQRRLRHSWHGHVPLSRAERTGARYAVTGGGDQR